MSRILYLCGLQKSGRLRHSNEQSLGSAIREFLHAYRLEEKFNEKKLIHAWEKVMGRMIAVHTKEIRVQKRVLFVKIDSPALRNELTYSRTKIVEMLNREAGTDVIDDVVIN